MAEKTKTFRRGDVLVATKDFDFTKKVVRTGLKKNEIEKYVPHTIKKGEQIIIQGSVNGEKWYRQGNIEGFITRYFSTYMKYHFRKAGRAQSKKRKI